MIRTSALALAASFASLAYAPSIAHAAAPSNAWVSALRGADNGICGPVSRPCRSLQFAVNLVAAGGAVLVADAGEYGPVKIVKAVSIINDGVGDATITTINGGGNTAIDIAIPANSDVLIKGLTLIGGGAPANGVAMSTVGNLTIQNCQINGFGGNGVFLKAPSAGVSKFLISDTSFLGNVGNALSVDASAISTSNASVSGILRNVTANRNGGGLMFTSFVYGSVNVVVQDSVIAQNSSYGIYAQFGASVRLSRVTAIQNGDGKNSFDLNSPGSIITYQNNIWNTLGGSVAVSGFQ